MDILQALQDQYTTNTNLSTAIPLDDTVPLSSEGVQVLSQAITLASPDSRILVKSVLWGQANAAAIGWSAAIFRSSTCIQAQAQLSNFDDIGQLITMSVLEVPGSVGPHSYSVRVGANTNHVRLNGKQNGRRFGGVAKCTLTLLEIG